MYPKKFYGMTLAEILISMGISAFIMCAVLGLLSNTVIHKRLFSALFDEWRKRARILYIIESRVANAGLGVPKSENVEGIFRFSPSGASALPGWKNVLEILTMDDIPVHFQDVDGEQVARGRRMRVLSTFMAAPDIRILPSGAEWGPGEARTVNLSKIKNRYAPYYFDPGELSSWITTLSLRRPIIMKGIYAPYESNAGSVELQNPMPVSMDWFGIDMFHSFRIAYFHVEAETLYIRDSLKNDTTNAVPSVSLHPEPVVDGVLSACFEFNKTAKTLQCWFLLRIAGPMSRTGLPPEWPAWAALPYAVYNNNVKVFSYLWNIKNI